MVSEEALAQILITLLLFTVGIPALIIEGVEAPLRRLLQKRIRPIPIIRLGVLTLIVVALLITFAGVNISLVVETLLKIVVILLIAQFVWAWGYIYRNVAIDSVINRLVEDIKMDGKINDDELEVLNAFGENLKGGEKDHVINVIGDLCGQVQQLPGYDGTQLKELLRGMQRVVVSNGTMTHHQSAHRVITKCWKLLVQKNLVEDADATLLKEVAGVLGSLAVSSLLGSMPQRWMSSIPYVLDVPYEVGVTAIRAQQYPIAIEALARISWTAEAQHTLPPQMIALVAHFDGAGPSAGRTAREFLDKLGHSPDAIRAAAVSAASWFAGEGDYATADAIGTFLEAYR
jgi:hypothetical protein